jgi:hypothetical protein
MMRHGRRASLLAAFSLLASVATAYAECAWVLWGHDRKTSRAANATESTWQPLEASSSEGGCGSKLKDQMAKVERLRTLKPPDDENMYYRVGDGVVALLWFRKDALPDDPPLRTQTLTYSCLPDTIDPRGPKVK